MPASALPKLQKDALRPDTRALLERLESSAELEDFVLIGGTAMALHVAHRESEDLDFVYVPRDGTQNRSALPLATTQSVVRRLRSEGADVVSLLDQFDIELAHDQGAYLPDHHQDWAVDGVKLTFFAGDTADRVRPFHQLDMMNLGHTRLLTLEAIFETKSRLLVQRSTSRDLFDLWYFLDRCGRSVEEIVAFAKAERPHYSDDLILSRLTPVKPSLTDPGFKPIAYGAPSNYAELVTALATYVDGYQQRVAAKIAEEDDTLRP